MIDSKKSCCRMLGSDGPMTTNFDQIIALGFYDGPTDGFLCCGECHREFHFNRVDSRLDSPEDGDIRIFELSPIPEGSLANFSVAMSPYHQPSRPYWLPTWSFPSEQDREQMDALVDRIIAQQGPVEWIIASSSWLAEILAARAVQGETWNRDQDWFTVLGLVGTAIGD